MIKKLSGLFFVMIVSACSDYESQIIHDINSNFEKYNGLIESVEKCNFSTNLYGKFISKDKFPDSLNSSLIKTKLKDQVNYIVIDKKNECNGINVEFFIGNTHLEFVSCPDSEFPEPNSYREEGFIEIWGINANWFIWRDNNFI